MEDLVSITGPPIFQTLTKKRARPASSHASSRSASDHHDRNHSAKRGKDLGVLKGSSQSGQSGSGYTSMSSWGSNVMTTAAAVISGALPLAAAQTDEGGTVAGHQTTYGPTTVLGQPGSLGGETSMPLPCTGAASHYPPLSPPFTTDHVPNLTESAFETFRESWPSSTFTLDLPMLHDPVYPFYSQNDSGEDLIQGPYHQMYPNVLPDGATPSMTNPDDMSTHHHHHPDRNFPIPEGGFNMYPVSYDFGSLMDAPRIPRADGLPEESEWTDVGHEQSSDDASPTSSGESPSAYSSPRAAPDPRSPLVREPWICIPAPTDPPTEVYDETTASDSSSSGSCHSPRNEPKPRKGMRHQPLNAGQREQASNTRRMGACMRCQMQRKTCEPNSDPLRPCRTCEKVVPDSKKVIHRLPCVRWKLTSTVLFRSGGLDFTQRQGWKGTAMKDLGPSDWADDVPRTIHITLGLCNESIELNVRKFKPVPGDVTARPWMYRGRKYLTEIEPYALADIQKFKKTYRDYVSSDSRICKAVCKYATNERVHGLVRSTYMAAYHHMNNVDYEPANVNARLFMQDFFKLWFATRHSLGSAWINGPDKLDMQPETRPGYPFHGMGKVNIPRLVAQQFDAVNYNTILAPTRARVLQTLWKLMHGKEEKYFYTVYLTVFILLHEASATLKDAYWHARQDQSPNRYKMGLFMEELQEGTNIILWAWHYYRRSFNPLDADWEKIRSPEPKKNLYRNIRPDQEMLMRQLAEVSRLDEVPLTEMERTGWDGLEFDPKEENPLLWERDLHFVSQMFKENWSPAPTWQS